MFVIALGLLVVGIATGIHASVTAPAGIHTAAVAAFGIAIAGAVALLLSPPLVRNDRPGHPPTRP